MSLSPRDLERLIGVHPKLVQLMTAVAEHESIVILEGVRSPQRQKQLLKAKATTTLKSRHLTGHAVDVAPKIGGQVSWHWPHYNHLAIVVKAVAENLNVPVEWGGDWISFKDGPHWQLPWKYDSGYLPPTPASLING